jgi:hypothetical protein
MMCLLSSVYLLAGCSAPHIVLPLEQNERALEASEVPAAARERLEVMAGGHSITEFEWEDRGAFIAYEAEWFVDGVEQEATVLVDGTIIETAQQAKSSEFSKLPPAIRLRVEALRADGYEVGIARRQFIVYEIDAWQAVSASTGDDVDAPEAIELLLQPDGRPANRDH